MTCRICTAPTEEILDLGTSPPANWLKQSPSDAQESYPLVLEWCERCGNVQLRDTVSAEALYRDYLYVTPTSTLLTDHYERLSRWMFESGYLSPAAFVVEPGSNAGLFLDHLRPSVRKVLGVDPAVRIAALANEAGIPTVCDFFHPDSARRIVEREGHADIVVARHCLAHNPSPHEMVEGAREGLAPGGYFVIENAYVAATIERMEFDQVYHEHMFYFSVRSMASLLGLHGMRLIDVSLAPIHGGSIVFVAQVGGERRPAPAVAEQAEREAPFLTQDAFARFAAGAAMVKTQLQELVSGLMADGSSIYSYGATAKGNTLLNYVGLTNAQIPYCVDSTPMKWGRYLPGSNIEVISEEAAAIQPPDYYLLTAWNYEDEILSKVRGGGNEHSKFIVPVPNVRIR
jgi:SAM-dependent methyltransferase